jgi:uncharacterized protein (TIGR02145 family)
MKYHVKHVIQGLIAFSFILHSCWKEKEAVPILVTGEVIDLTWEKAQGGGRIIDEGSSDVFDKGVCWSTEINPTLAENRTWGFYLTDISFYCFMYNLKPTTTYYVRAFAINKSGIGYGNEISFSTMPNATTATAELPTYIGLNSAMLSGTIRPDHIETTARFEYGPTTSYGYILPGGSIINGNDTSKTISSLLSDLSERTSYHYRIEAVNWLGTTYSNDIEFTTLDKAISGTIFNPDLTYGSINDIEGNIYKTIQIGDQTWMAENLRTTSFNDGTSISLMPSVNTRPSIPIYGYCWYYNDPGNSKATYGALFTWYTIDKTSNGNKNICPEDWHIPSDNEWTSLTTFLGGEGVSGSKLKETGTIHWDSPNTGATNLSGFSALPGGYYNGNSEFSSTGVMGYWWSSTVCSDNSDFAWYRVMYNNFNDVSRAEMNKQLGLYVRCIKDPQKNK